MDVAAVIQLVPERLRPIYQRHWRTIRESVKLGRLRDVYHYPLIRNSNTEIISKADTVMINYTSNV